MNDATSNEQHAHINRRLRRLHRLTLASLCLNALLVLLCLLGAILHHHDRIRGDAGGGSRGMDERMGREDFHGGFHHRRGMDRGGWDRHQEFGRERERNPEDDRVTGPGFPPQGGRDQEFPSGGPRHGMGMGMMGGGDPAQMSDMLLAHLTAQLTLSDDQKAKIKPILQQQVTLFQKTMEDHRAAMQKQIEDAKAKLKPILNADQQKQLDQMPMPGQKPPASGPKPGV